MKRIAAKLMVGAALGLAITPLGVADSTPQTLPYSQDWTNTRLITVTDDWSGVPGAIGYRGDDLTIVTGTDPQTILVDGTSTPIDVNVNQTNPNTLSAGGLAEFEIANPVVALNGSGTGDAPFLLINLDTTGQSNIRIRYNLRDLDSSGDNSIQPIALHYRVGSTGDFTNVPDAFVADASSGPNLATLVTAIDVTLPSDANNQALVQIRIMTTNAVGNDEWIGIDDIQITSGPMKDCPADIAPSGGNGQVNVDDLLAVIAGWGPCPAPPATCPADIAPTGGNGQVNVDDLLAVIANWGPCP